MVLESTMVCVDNSDYMRNGDFVPTRLQSQQDAVNLICHSKTRSNPENNVGLLTLASLEVLATLTTDVGRILSKLHQVQPKGSSRFVYGVRIAHLALKHRQGKNHKMRIIIFIGSPIDDDEKEIIKLAKKLKKEKVNVDVINFGEENLNIDKLTNFVNTMNGKDGTSSHLVTVPPGPMLSDALLSSPIVVGEDGTGAVPGGMGGFDFGVDPNEDPELALALRVSMEENRARQEEEARKVAKDSALEAGVTVPGEGTEQGEKDTTDDALLKQALEMSMQVDAEPEDTAEPTPPRDVSMMTEEEQIAYAMQMSLAAGGTGGEEECMDTEEANPTKPEPKNDQDEDYSDVINDPAFLQSVLEGLPGVDPENEAIRSAMGALTQKEGENKEDKKKEEKK